MYQLILQLFIIFYIDMSMYEYMYMYSSQDICPNFNFVENFFNRIYHCYDDGDDITIITWKVRNTFGASQYQNYYQPDNILLAIFKYTSIRCFNKGVGHGQQGHEELRHIDDQNSWSSAQAYSDIIQSGIQVSDSDYLSICQGQDQLRINTTL